MKKLAALIIIIIVAFLGWKHLSPLFIDEVVDEAFPIVVDTGEGEELSDEMMEVMKKIEGHPTTQAEIDAMTEEEKTAMEIKIVEEFSKEPDTVMEEPMPEAVKMQANLGGGSAENQETEIVIPPIKIASGTFKDADSFHKGNGNAFIFQQSDGSGVARFENFSVTNGPDLRVYLVSEQDPSKTAVQSGLQLGKLKGNKGNQNYNIPAGTDLSAYKSVVIYCQPYNVIFSVANLN